MSIIVIKQQIKTQQQQVKVNFWARLLSRSWNFRYVAFVALVQLGPCLCLCPSSSLSLLQPFFVQNGLGCRLQIAPIKAIPRNT